MFVLPPRPPPPRLPQLLIDRLRELDAEDEVRRLTAASTARARDLAHALHLRRQQEVSLRWSQHVFAASLHSAARETVRAGKGRISVLLAGGRPPPVQDLSLLVYCLRRFPSDAALQVDCFSALQQCAARSPPVCQFLLEENVAAALTAALEATDDKELRDIAETLAGLLAGADDLRRAMPIAFERDIKKLKAGQRKADFLSEERFWEELTRKITEGNAAADKSNVGPKKDSPGGRGNFLLYEMSTDNSTLLKSIFDRRAVFPFDSSSRVKTPPLVSAMVSPPPLACPRRDHRLFTSPFSCVGL